MQIHQQSDDGELELRLTGRVDAAWGEHLRSTIDEAVRGGSHRVALNCAGVDYISSLGIGVIVSEYRLLKSVNGSLVVRQPSRFVRQVLTMVGLDKILIEGAANGGHVTQAPTPVQRLTRGGAVYETYSQPVMQPLNCTLIGDPVKLATTGFSAADCHAVSFPTGTFGLGLGAFGAGFADCENRFGEFLAAGGCAFALPSSEAGPVPDYVIQEGGLIPRIETLYGLTGTGDFSTMVRFDSTAEGPGTIGLSELVTALLDLSASPIIAFVALAEATCIVGASLMKSPALQPLPHRVPEMRDWLSFTTERVSNKSLALLVGIAGSALPTDALEFLRPLQSGSPISTHMHAVLFPYRPVQRGELPFAGTISKTITASNPAAILHLMSDTRAYGSVGETALARGACWMGPLRNFTRG